MRLLVNVEVMLTSCDSELIYWASGSRGLVTGSIMPSTGELKYNLLQEAPPPESGLFAHRRVRPVPIAVGRASGLALVQETDQLWVGTENGQMGSVYVFKLPDMRRNHHIHLQDAVLSLCAINQLADVQGGKEMQYRVLVGLANGTIILFLGLHEGKVLDNPLQGPKLVIATHQRKPCLTMTLTTEGRLWCSCGDSMEMYDVCSLKHLHRLSPSQGGRKGDGITLMVLNATGVWTVGRRSTLLRLWDQKTGQYKASYDVS
jgi:leucine-rich repeat kinase 1